MSLGANREIGLRNKCLFVPAATLVVELFLLILGELFLLLLGENLVRVRLCIFSKVTEFWDFNTGEEFCKLLLRSVGLFGEF